MELRVLKYFLEVARHENISRAADELHLTQPTLSRQIAELEEELGTALLVRGKRRTLLTESGLFLKARAEEIPSFQNGVFVIRWLKGLGLAEQQKKARCEALSGQQ